MTNEQKKKLSSRRFWIVIICIFIGTLWGTISLLKDTSPGWMAGTMLVIFGVPASYITITSIKKTDKKEEEEGWIK